MRKQFFSIALFISGISRNSEIIKKGEKKKDIPQNVNIRLNISQVQKLEQRKIEQKFLIWIL